MPGAEGVHQSGHSSVHIPNLHWNPAECLSLLKFGREVAETRNIISSCDNRDP